MDNQLEQLRQFTTVVADTGDFESMRAYRPQDATTNPTLILQATQKPEYRYLVERAIRDTETKNLRGQTRLDSLVDNILVAFGQAILEIIPGRVSTEVDARLSFDTAASIDRARHIILLYEKLGIPRERILIKVAATWEGIEAAQVLEEQGIHTNLTLMFSLVQAVTCAHASVTLISPFVGRIYDWYKKQTGTEYGGADDPGVRSVQSIYTYFKKFGHTTEIMGASFRNVNQITELAGCDLLTIAPSLLEELASSETPLERKLHPADVDQVNIEPLAIDEKSFRFLLNEDAMATEKTAEGIRRFCADIRELEKQLTLQLPD